MTRRTILSSPLFLLLKRTKSILTSRWNSASNGGSSEPGLPEPQNLILDNGNHRLEFDSQTARLRSLRAAGPGNQEFIPADDHHPVFAIQYLDSNAQFQQIDSTAAKEVHVRTEQRTSDDGQRGTELIADFVSLGGLDLSVTVTVTGTLGKPDSLWTLSLRNNTNLLITDVQFPMIVVSYDLGGEKGTETLLQPIYTGRLFKAPQPQDLEPDSPHAWQFRPENGDTSHYPGSMFAQFLAYYNNRAGVYIACQDTSGAIKRIKPVHSGSGIRLGIAHVGDWPSPGERKLEYPVVVQTFAGDWYDAAELYRTWSLAQGWAARPLHKRDDVPNWLLDSPPHIIVRIQGQLDAGPDEPNQQFLPYPKIVPLLENISKRIDSPIVAVIMAWERPGSWIYPDCFPPAGGDQSLTEFAGMMKDRNWHVGSFCNGTRWVIHHFWTGYDGRQYFAEQHAEETVCKTHEQQPWREWWDQTWRPSFACCLAVSKTLQIARSFIDHLVADGLDWVQFLDQNIGCSTFPCYAKDHGHPPYPGKWMTAAMQSLLGEFKQVAAEANRESAGKRTLAFSVEQPPNEYFMSAFQICDVRVIPPGHKGWQENFIPLYHFLYHEFLVLQGGFGSAPEPHHMPIRSAYNLVVGEIPGGVLTGDGLLLNRDTFNWAPWKPPVGNNDDSLESLRTTTALRRGKARDFLVLGRMQRPSEIMGVQIVKWEYEGIIHRIPAVFHSAWQNPQGKFGIVLANWTKEAQTVRVADSRLGREFTESISASEVTSRVRNMNREASVTLQPLSCTLLEAS